MANWDKACESSISVLFIDMNLRGACQVMFQDNPFKRFPFPGCALLGALVANVPHMAPGWERLAHRVLDIVESEGADLRHTVLCHMNPSLHDHEYQRSLADRGAFLEYDMIGMDYFYADQQARSPCDEENAIAICKLVEDGYVNCVLMSQDVFLKMILTRYDGFGYVYILKHFVPRLKRHGMNQAMIDRILVENPRRVCSARIGRSRKRQSGKAMTDKRYKILLAGESWVTTATHIKGFDQFATVTFHLGAEPLRGQAESRGADSRHCLRRLRGTAAACRRRPRKGPDARLDLRHRPALAPAGICRVVGICAPLATGAGMAGPAR